MTPFAADELASAAALGHDDRFRQLRHQTKNALQSLMIFVASSPEVEREGGRALSEQLQRRILLVAALSDALFGLTRAPGSLQARLALLAEGVVGLLGADEARIDVHTSVRGTSPPELDDAIVRIAHELLGDAVRHGMRLRLLGRIRMELRAERSHVALTVADDGWRRDLDRGSGEGPPLVSAVAARHGGTAELRRSGDWTVASVIFPRPRLATCAPIPEASLAG